MTHESKTTGKLENILPDNIYQIWWFAANPVYIKKSVAIFFKEIYSFNSYIKKEKKLNLMTIFHLKSQKKENNLN